MAIMKKKQSFDLTEFRKNDMKSEKENVEKRNDENTVVAEKDEPKGLKGDYSNICLLLVLYFLQGIPLGIGDVIPLILVNKGVTYDEQALFSFSHWPFSIKLLWAPIVDSVYSTRFGRRKSWFVPVQYAIGFFLIILGYSSEHLLGDDSSSPKIVWLTVVFFMLVFLTATQDVAVDGWALTLLSKRNVHYAPSCNSVGQTVGSLFGSTVFLALESKDFCNRWLRSEAMDTGIVSFKGYLFVWGIVFITVTTCVWMFKHETDHIAESGEKELGIIETYRMLWKILCLSPVRCFVLILLTYRIGTAAADSVTSLKLVEYGIKRENIGILKLPLIPLQLILPWIITKFTTKKPLTSFYFLYPFRLLITLIAAFMVWGTNHYRADDSSFSPSFYTLIVIGFAFLMTSSYATGMTTWAFMAQVSDPLVGGTYMTLLTTVSNLGASWTNTVSLYFVKVLTFNWCPKDGYFCAFKETTNASLTANVSLVNITLINTNTTNNSIVEEKVTIDGYYVEVIVSLFLGLLWMAVMYKFVKWLQSQPKTSWRCK